MIALDVMLFALTLTVIVEGSLAALLPRIRTAGAVWDIALINLVTNPMAQLIWIVWNPCPEAAICWMFLVLEAALVLGEAILLRRLRIVHYWEAAVGASLLLNAASTLFGLSWLVCL